MEFDGIVQVCFVISYAITPIADSTIQLNPSATPPPSASPPIDPSFEGFCTEPSNLLSFMGAEEPNTLTRTLLSHLPHYAGKLSHVRIGGNTQDYMIFQETRGQCAWLGNDYAVGQRALKPDSMLVGPRFFEAADRLPNDRASAIYQQVLQPKGIQSSYFEAAATAPTTDTGLCVADTIAFDISPNTSGCSTSCPSGWNQHDYYYNVGSSKCPITLEQLMESRTTRGQFTAMVGQVNQHRHGLKHISLGPELPPLRRNPRRHIRGVPHDQRPKRKCVAAHLHVPPTAPNPIAIPRDRRLRLDHRRLVLDAGLAVPAHTNLIGVQGPRVGVCCVPTGATDAPSAG
ncbi:hypothetical protein F5Y13DRAFT_191533 [Hypoxylon sp. FL1857]|nr:hypothetical protein F5Y13DRAFT_191533 [Hypoxylon sp. FL1857]